MTRAFLALTTILACTLTSCQTTSPAPEPDNSSRFDPEMTARLLGTHPFSLQWISWDDFGRVNITREAGKIRVRGSQRGNQTDYITIDGEITQVTRTHLQFQGTIEIQVDHLNGGLPYQHQGQKQFGIYGTNRNFWRLVEMENPDSAVDYVDIYFDEEAARQQSEY